MITHNSQNNGQAPEVETLTDRNIASAIENGTKAAWARHKAHDEASCKAWQARQRSLEYQNESDRCALANAYREAYQTEASYYIG